MVDIDDVVLGIMIFFVGFVFVFGIVVIVIFAQESINDQYVLIGEGVIESMRMDRVVIGNSDLYYITILGKEYSILEGSYNAINIGDYVQVFKSGRVVVVVI